MATKKAAPKASAKKAAVKRKQTARRTRVLREDASIESAVTTIEKLFKLPSGSVKLVYQSGRRARSDSTVGRLRQSWEP